MYCLLPGMDKIKVIICQRLYWLVILEAVWMEVSNFDGQIKIWYVTS